jgi:hypothetical protein
MPDESGVDDEIRQHFAMVAIRRGEYPSATLVIICEEADPAGGSSVPNEEQ